MPALPTFGVLGDPAAAVEVPTAESPFRIAVLGDFSGRGHHGAKATADGMLGRKSYKITRENFDDIVALLKVKAKLPNLQGEAFEHEFASLDDFHPDQIHEKADRFAFLSDDDDKSEMMAALLHHPDVQALESCWRGVDWLLKRAQKGGNKVEVVLYDISRAEFAAALNASDDLAASPLYKVLIEQAMQGPKGQPWALWLGLYRFDLFSQDAQLLGRIAKIARHAAAPFLAGAKGTILGEDFTLDPDASAAWTALRQLPEAALLGLALPRFLLRPPYGENTITTERFDFDEFKRFTGKRDYCWGNAGLAAAALLTQSFFKEGWAFKTGTVLDLEGMPMHAYTQDDEEEQVLAETWLVKPMPEKAVKHGLMPLLCVKRKDAMQLLRFCSLAMPPKDQPAAEFVGRWAQAGLAALPRSTSAKPGFGVGVQFPGAPAATRPPAAAPAAPPAPTAPAAASPPPAAAPAPAPADALDPELAALMAQFDSPAAPAAAAEPAPAPADALDPELAALMAQFETPAAPPPEPAPAAEPAPVAEPASAADDGLDPELAALMAQFETPAAPPPEPAPPPAPAEELDPELAALMAQFESPAPAAPPEPPPEEPPLDPELAALMKQMEAGS